MNNDGNWTYFFSQILSDAQNNDWSRVYTDDFIVRRSEGCSCLCFVHYKFIIFCSNWAQFGPRTSKLQQHKPTQILRIFRENYLCEILTFTWFVTWATSESVHSGVPTSLFFIHCVLVFLWKTDLEKCFVLRAQNPPEALDSSQSLFINFHWIVKTGVFKF